MRARRNRFGDAALATASGAAILLVLAILAVILGDVVEQRRAAPVVLLPHQAPSEGMTAGGIFPAIVRHGRDGRF